MDYTVGVYKEIREQEELIMRRQWFIKLNTADVWRQRTILAIMPNWHEWLDRDSGFLSFRATQLMTGHGSFGHFLHRIGKRGDTGCYHCNEVDDTVEHTFPSRNFRRVLIGT
ncbi:reverse transcriptase [Lasius niger]|uniref:Reverse transcriptase n=1 Tax=Lasius niger TaxID=67767 RepID=A0A0J7KLL7_LASNI|nr:reverse transcriptase [Lasius niger]